MRGTRSRLTADVELFACNIVDNIVCFFVPRTIYDMQVQVQWGTVKNGFFCEWGLIGGAFCARSLIPSFKEYMDLNRFGRTLWLISC